MLQNILFVFHSPLQQCTRGVARNLLRGGRGGREPGGLGTEVPQRGPGAEPPVWVWGRSPQKPETNVDKKNKQIVTKKLTYGDGETCTHAPLLPTPCSASSPSSTNQTWCMPKIGLSQMKTTGNMRLHSSTTQQMSGVDTVGQIVLYYSC